MIEKYLLGLVLATMSLFSFSEGIFESSIKNLDPSVETLSWCGNWKHNGIAGRYRILYGYVYEHTELYVQWIADPDYNNSENHTVTLLSTIGVNTYDHSATYLDKIQCIKSGKRWKIIAKSENGYEDKPKPKRLEVSLFDEPGKFEIKVY